MRNKKETTEKKVDSSIAKEPKQKGNAGKVIKIIAIILIVVIILILILQNLTAAPIAILFWKGQLPVIAIMLIFGLLGFLLGILVFSLIFRGSRPKQKSKKGKDKDKEEEEIDIDGQI